MATTLSDIRFIVEKEIEDELTNSNVVNWANMAHNDFLLRVYIPANTTLVIDKTTLVYPLPPDIREIRRIRRQSDIDNGINRAYNPVYTFYNSNFEVPSAFDATDTLLIDYYRHLTYFTDVANVIDLPDRFNSLYSSFFEMRYFKLPSTMKNLGANEAESRYQMSFGIYLSTKKQIANAYNIDIGVQKPHESGW